MNIAFILDHPLKSYRVPFFNLLYSRYGHKIVIYHPGNMYTSEFIDFKQVITPDKKIFNIFFFRKKINSATHDVVICMQNMRMLNLWILSINKFRRYKLIQWGIGVSSASGLNSERSFTRLLRNFLITLADAVVFYTPFSMQFVNRSHLNKCFVAQNTIYNNLSEDFSSHPKSSFIFIGSLNKRKGLREMIKIFHQYINNNPINIKTLYIIGDGEEYNYLKEYIDNNELQENIFLLGKIENMQEKISFFKRSIASISLNQAGLSVLESFSFGVPFITKEKAISGGEHLNIKNNENGYLIQNTNELLTKMMYLDENVEYGQILGHNAFSYYHNKASMELMVDNFERAIKYTSDPKNK